MLWFKSNDVKLAGNFTFERLNSNMFLEKSTFCIVLFLPNRNDMSPTSLLREKSSSVKFKSPKDFGTVPANGEEIKRFSKVFQFSNGGRDGSVQVGEFSELKVFEKREITDGSRNLAGQVPSKDGESNDTACVEVTIQTRPITAINLWVP
ncbi:unnamed protein product [Ilex paraguariensis]|uniref:Uncharacterized protein n=1 Tax=Ilex paraguariensis TaxID=185542 RepID=A0ABC8UL39_9AQUA